MAEIRIPTAKPVGGDDVSIVDTTSAADRHPKLSTICTKCESMFAMSVETLREEFECYSYAALQNSAQTGCQICVMVFNTASARMAREVKRSDGWPDLSLPYSIRLYPRGLRGMTLHFVYSYDNDVGGRYEITLGQLLLLEWQHESSQIRHDSLHKNTGSNSNVKLARNWMRVCQTLHTECIALSDSQHASPSRLIHLGLSDDSLRLHIVNNDTVPSLKYVTLSHCWGKLEFTKLSQSNLASFQKSIPYQQLPLTFKNAIYIARSLGFRYLWIDSLCIIQDDKDDWEREAPRMASVYGGSSLNISATAAKDGSEGLFFDRDTSFVERCIVLASPDLLESSVVKDTLHSGESTKILAGCSYTNLYGEAFSLPLLGRGWVLQERYLAPRTLHFGHPQMFWECQKQVCFETFPNGIPISMGPEDDEAIGEVTWIIDKKVAPLLLWCRIVSLYTRCDLTFARDKLVALSGIAESYQSQYGGTYIYGLWKEHLPGALLWKTDSYSFRPTTQPLPTIAPTWSWANTSAPIDCGYNLKPTPQTTPRIQVLGILTFATETSVLQIQCSPLLELNPYTFHDLGRIWAFSQPAFDPPPDKRLEIWLELDTDFQPQDIPRLYALSVYATVREEQDEIYDSAESDDSEQKLIDQGLLLQRVEHKKGFFRRVGMYESSYDEFTTFEFARPVTEFEREFVYERVIEDENGEADQCIINLE